MVGPRIYHIKHARSYPAFTADDPAKVMDLATQWLKRHDFRVKRKSKQYSRGSKRGIHVNFVPKFKLFIEQGPNGHYVVRFDYYAKIKLGTAVVVGVLTSGISTVVGVGTLAIALSDADNFVDKFWKHIDSLARGNPVILTVERWASDGKGGFVKQPLPPGTAVSTPPPVQPLPPPPPPVHYAPPPPPPAHVDNRPRETRPPPVQPGQVYGHTLMQAPVLASAPPPPPQYYPKLEKSNPPPPTNPAAYGNYPPPPSPHGHYPPPPSPHNAYPHLPPPPHSYQPPTPAGHPGYPPPSPAHGYPPPPPAHSYQPPTPGGYPPPPPSQQGQRPPSQHGQRPPPPQQAGAPRRPPPTPQGYADAYGSSHHDAAQDGYAAHHDSYAAYYDSHGDRQSYYGGDNASQHSYYAAYTDPSGVYHEQSYFEKRASTGSDDIPDSASSFAEQHGLGRYAEHHAAAGSRYSTYSEAKSQASGPAV